MPDSWEYNDGTVPAGGFIVDLKTGVGAGTAVGSYIVESFDVTRPGNVVNRPSEVGGPNGWTVSNAQETATGTLQIATTATETPKIGHWFSKTFDRKQGASAETWVITSVSEPFEINGYAKVNCSFQRSHTHPSA